MEDRNAGNPSSLLSRWHAVLLFGAFVLACLFLMGSPGTGDVAIAQRWVDNVLREGFRGGFVANQADYPPLSSVMLWLFAKLTSPLHMDTFWILKTACFCCLMASSALILLLDKSILGAILLVPALMLESAGFAYLDVFYTPALIIALWALRERRLRTFSLAIAIAALIKWQPLIIFPFILAHLLKDEDRGFTFRNLWPAFYPGAILGLAVLAFYGPHNMRMAFNAAMGHPYLSGNAMNLGWIITYYLHLHDPAQYGGLNGLMNHFIKMASDDFFFAFCHQIFSVLFGLTFVVFMLRRRSLSDLLFYSAIGLLCYVNINPGAHENHSYVAVVLLILAALREARYWPHAAFVAVMLNVNLILFYGLGLLGELPRSWPPMRVFDGFDLTVAFSGLNLLFFAGLWIRHVGIETWRSYRNAYLGRPEKNLVTAG